MRDSVHNSFIEDLGLVNWVFELYYKLSLCFV